MTTVTAPAPHAMTPFGDEQPINLFQLGALFVGWVFNVFFWWAFIGILYHVAKRNITLTFLGVCIAFLGTPIGFYSSVHASESLTFSCLAVLLYWVLTQEDWELIDFFFSVFRVD